MGGELLDINLRVIGVVRSDIRQPARRDWTRVVSEIVVDSSLMEALDGLEEFSHLIVLYWMHQVTAKPPVKIHPRGKEELPLVGLFATRSPIRPNSIGQTLVRLIKREGNILTVEGLDAIDGTPVIDIKPYIPGYDSASDAKVPTWVTNQ